MKGYSLFVEEYRSMEIAFRGLVLSNCVCGILRGLRICGFDENRGKSSVRRQDAIWSIQWWDIPALVSWSSWPLVDHNGKDVCSKSIKNLSLASDDR